MKTEQAVTTTAQLELDLTPTTSAAETTTCPARETHPRRCTGNCSNCPCRRVGGRNSNN